MERSEIQYGQTLIPYSIVRSRREKTVAIAVDPVDGVQVRAPRQTPLDKLDAIVRRKARWIAERRQHVADLPPPPSPREFVSGETFLYLGRQYRLRVVEAEGTDEPRVRMLGSHLIVDHPRGEARSRTVQRQLTAWYREHAAARLPERVQHWAAAVGVEPSAVLIREPRKRWGSVDAAGVVRFNWRVVQAPMRIVDYIVAHELVHLRHPDHGRAFWSALGQVMPDYDIRREELRRLGRVMVW